MKIRRLASALLFMPGAQGNQRSSRRRFTVLVKVFLMIAMETFDLIIGRADDADSFEWTIAAGADCMENGVEDDIVTCLHAAVSCFRNGAPVKFTINYQGTEVGEYSGACLLVNAVGVADSIIERAQGL